MGPRTTGLGDRWATRPRTTGPRDYGGKRRAKRGEKGSGGRRGRPEAKISPKSDVQFGKPSKRKQSKILGPKSSRSCLRPNGVLMFDGGVACWRGTAAGSAETPAAG